MQTEKLQKIKQLIETSRILSPQEKAEWLALLELMDDKQLMELEKILTSPGSKNQEPRTKNQNGLPMSVVPTQQSLPAQQMPKLSHISNLPRTEISKPHAAPVLHQDNDLVNRLKQMGTPANIPSTSLGTSSPSTALGAFGKKLKSIFAEKELSTSKQEFPLELSASLPKPVTPPVVKPAPVPIPPVIPKPKPVIAEPVIQKISSPPLKTNAPIKPITFPPINIPGIGSLKPTQQAKPKESPAGFVPGINFTKPTERAKQDDLASIREHVLEAKPPGVVKEAVTLSAKPGIETLPELVLLDTKTLEENDYNSLLKKIRDLISANGYHETLFNIEKSPLYKSYIKTGMEILTKNTGFEQLSGSAGVSLLNRQQFEKFTDLLRQIQTG